MWYATILVGYNKSNQKIQLDHLLHIVMLLGILYNMLQAWGLFIVLVILLEFCILFYSSQPTCKPEISKLANESITDCFYLNNNIGGRKMQANKKWQNVPSDSYYIILCTCRQQQYWARARILGKSAGLSVVLKDIFSYYRAEHWIWTVSTYCNRYLEQHKYKILDPTISFCL